MGATRRTPPRRLGVRGGFALQLAHRENRSKNSLLVYPGAAFPAPTSAPALKKGCLINAL
jgi:hypothetical protein